MADDTFDRAEYEHTAALLRSGDEAVVNAALSNNYNIILAALDQCIAARPDAVPRRSRVGMMTPAELAIRSAQAEVEKLGASPYLTDAGILLGRARDKVADFVDGKPRTRT